MAPHTAMAQQTINRRKASLPDSFSTVIQTEAGNKLAMVLQ
jgi:hypothetical protein